MKRSLLALILLLCFCSIKAQQPYASFNHIAIEVRNLDKSVAFYSKLFHLDSIQNPWPGRRITWFKIGPTEQLHVIEADANEKIIPVENFHFCFSVHSISDFISILKKENISYDDGNGKKYAINRRPDGVQQIYIKDPDGYMVEINDQAQ